MSISLGRSLSRLFPTRSSQSRSLLHPPQLRLLPLTLLLLAALAPAAHAQVITPLQRQLQRLDFAVNAVALLSTNTTGTNYLGQTLTDTPGNTVGALVTLRYTVKPYVGFEGNFSYARFTQKFNTIGGVQANADEYTLGYVAHPPVQLFGTSPFVSIGAGSTAYKPTPGGGQGLLTQARATYYYAAGIDGMLSQHFGARAQFRQSISLAPDFGQNYLTIKQRTITTEPGFGFFYKF